MQKISREKYGLSAAYVKNFKLPAPVQVKIYNVSKIINSRDKLLTVEKSTNALTASGVTSETQNKEGDQETGQLEIVSLFALYESKNERDLN